jgi:hypothetical protein
MSSTADIGTVGRSGNRVVMAALLTTLALVPELYAGYQDVSVEAGIGYDAVAVTLLSLAALQLTLGVPDGGHGLARWRTGPWYLVWMALAFGVASLTWLGEQTGTALLISLSSVTNALMVVELSIVAWTVGYLTGAHRALGELARRLLDLLLHGTRPAIRRGGRGALPWILYAIGTTARLTTVVLDGGFGYVGDPSVAVSRASAYTQTLSMFSMAAVFGVAVAAHRVFSTRGPDPWGRFGLAVMVCLEAVVGALAGGKESFVVSVLAVLVPYGTLRGRLSWRILVLGALLFLWIVVPFNAAYRPVIRSDSGALGPVDAALAAPRVLATVLTDPPADSVGTSTSQLLYRIREIDNIAIVTQLTPSAIAYRSPVEFARAPVIGLVPRLLWPGKPVLVSGYDFTQEYYGLPSTVYSSSAVTPVGDLYRHGGWPVVMAGALVLGAACRLFDTLFRPERDPRAVFFVLVFLPVLVKSEMDTYTMIISIPAGVLTAALGAQLACRGPR